MKRARLLALALPGLLCTSGCFLIALGYPSYDINYATYRLPAKATRFAAVCTPQDDYNAAPPPMLEARSTLVFSSNRPGGAGGFDLVAYDMSATFNQDSGHFDLWARRLLDEDRSWNADRARVLDLLKSINSSADELGPSWIGYEQRALTFTSDRDGQRDVYLYGPELARPLPLGALNSPHDDGYACVVSASQSVAFDSNRGGDHDLYQTPLTTLPHDATSVAPLAALNSPANDRAPFACERRLVFASDRAGGQGGYDLYLSRYVDGRWTTPVNLGPQINSAADEFRPVIVPAPEFSNDLLLFSSNRPGGAGGYDLYYAGVDR